MHSARSLSILGVLVVAVVGAALFLVPRGDAPQSERALLYPALGDRINDVGTLVVRNAQGELLIENTGERWVVPSSHGYPADTGVVRRVLTGLADARIVEPKTGKPELYHRLGVADVAEEGSTAVQVTLDDDAGETLASVLVGDEAGSGDRYVRRAGEERAWRVTGVDEVPTGAASWLHGTIVDIGREEIVDIVVNHGDERIELSAGPGGEMNLARIPEGKQVAYQFALNDFASTLAGLELAAVRPAGDLDFTGELQGRVSIDDGTVIRFETARADDATWFRFGAVVGEALTEGAQMRANDMNARWEGWAYRLREADLERLRKRRDDLLEDVSGGNQGEAAEPSETGAAAASETTSDAGASAPAGDDAGNQ